MKTNTPDLELREEIVRLRGIIEDLLIAVSGVGTQIEIPGRVKLMPEVMRENHIAELRAEAARNLGVFIMQKYGLIHQGTNDKMNLVEHYRVFVVNPLAHEPALDLDALMVEFDVKREAAGVERGKLES
jgi:hypothetical protein